QIDRVMLYIKSMEDLTLGDVTDLSEESRQKLDSPDKGELIHLENGRILYRSNLSAVQSLYTNFGAYNALSKQGVDELQDIINVCIPSGFGYDRIRIDPSVVRGLEYYTGAVFEVELLIETKDEKGRPVRFGSVGGGGRYDGLVSRFRGEPVPATDFSIGVSRLQAALTALENLNDKPEPGRVVVTVLSATASLITKRWSPRCATPASAPSSISAIRRTISAPSSNTPTSAAALAPSSRAATKRSLGWCRSRI